MAPFALALGALNVHGAAAQTATTPNNAADAAPVALPEVTVTTANKRPQRTGAGSPTTNKKASSEANASPSPDSAGANSSGPGGEPKETADANVSVRSGAELKAAGVETVADLQKVFPGLRIDSRGNRAYANFTVRGISSPDFYNPSVQVLIDGVPQAAAALTQELVDVDRVEFLRGPQGVLYGANAFGGVLSIITRQPRQNTGSVAVTNANLKREVLGNATAVLMPDALFLDVAAKGEWDTGQIDDALTGRNNIDSGNLWAGRVSLRYQPSNGPFDGAITFSRDHVNSHEETYILDSDLQRRVDNTGIPRGFLDRTTSTASGLWNYRFDNGFTLTSISAYQDVDLNRSTFGYFFPESEKAFSQEARLTYTGPGPFTGVAGIYYRTSDFTRQFESVGDRNVIGTDTLAGFGELTWHLTQQLDLTAGVRVSDDRSTINYHLPVAFLNFKDEVNFHSVQPKFQIGYDLTPTSRIYALVSEGYKPGGFQHAITIDTPFGPSAGQFAPYKPETAWNYEAGFRTSLFRNSVDLSAAVYRINSTDKQIYVGPVGAQTIQNAGDATSTGVELEGTWRATRQLTLSGEANFGRSEFTHSVNPDNNGNQVPYAPDVTLNTHARYVFDQRMFGAIPVLRGDARFASSSYFDEANELRQGAYAIFDAAFELNWDNGIGMRLFADNIGDTIYREYRFARGPLVLDIPSEGRLVGLTVSAKY